MKVINIEDARRQARRRLPAPIYHYLEGGAEDEWSLRRNRTAFDHHALVPRALVDVSRIDLRCRMLGFESAMPLLLSPTGMSRLFHREGELGAARAAQDSGIPYALSTMATASIEEVARASSGAKAFQIYIFRDRGLTQELVSRCRQAGYGALILTVDTPLAGNRERDRCSGMVIPPRLGWRSLLGLARHPLWSIGRLLDPDFKLKNVASRVDALSAGAMGVIDYVNGQFSRAVTWADASWLAEQWNGTFALKGVLSAADARHAASIGASAVFVSNHGGRQLDGAVAPFDCLQAIRDKVGADIELILDGGVRRGTHILRALCAGATACSIGRPYLYGLAAAGRRGVEQVLDIFRCELERDLALLGCRSVEELSSGYLSRLPTLD